MIRRQARIDIDPSASMPQINQFTDPNNSLLPLGDIFRFINIPSNTLDPSKKGVFDDTTIVQNKDAR